MPTANETMISATQLVPVTPGNTDLVPHKAIWVGGAGTLSVVCADGTTQVIAGVAAGTLLPFQAKRIVGATTATNILLWV
jgi:hypothetical protein